MTSFPAAFIAALWAPSTLWILAILVVLGFAVRRAEQEGLDPLLMFVAGVAGLAGAGVGGDWYALAGTPHQVLENPWLLTQVLDGPKAMFGALVGTSLCGAGLLWATGASVRAYADAAAPAIALGYAVYRIGCLWNGCEAGTATTLPWAVTGPEGTEVHPVAAYHAVAGLLLYLTLRPLPVGTGRVALLALGGYGLLRFGIEFVRVEPVSWLGWNPGHWWSLVALAVALGGAWILRHRFRSPTTSRSSMLEPADA